MIGNYGCSYTYRYPKWTALFRCFLCKMALVAFRTNLILKPVRRKFVHCIQLTYTHVLGSFSILLYEGCAFALGSASFLSFRPLLTLLRDLRGKGRDEKRDIKRFRECAAPSPDAALCTDKLPEINYLIASVFRKLRLFMVEGILCLPFMIILFNSCEISIFIRMLDNFF